MKERIRLTLLALALLLALPRFAVGEGGPAATPETGTQIAAPEGTSETAEDEQEKPAESYSFFLRFDAPGHNGLPEKLLYDSLNQPESFDPYEQFSVQWAEDFPGHYLCVQWNVIPVGVRLRQYDRSGVLLSETDVPEVYDTILEVEEGTGRVTFLSDRQGMSVARIALYSKGILPESFSMDWLETPDHLDYLIISTHPDDDVIFMGAIAPIYGQERGYTGTVAYVTNPGRVRIHEALMGAWAMGVRHYPLFLGFRDINDNRVKEGATRFAPEIVTRAIVRLLRQYRPLVVFSQDLKGEYGHWQHLIVSAAVREACRLAADEGYDPDSVSRFGAWEVKKCYLHLYPENPLVLDVNTPLASMGGRTAIEVAQDAFLKHISQQNGRHWVQTDRDAHPLSRFGMAYGTVDAGADAFDNIDPALLIANSH
ncbi:MAG: PIG-L family deacetylase [Clostridia bacterium]|nr:PIG-L family deacetylase [Clostridia bacterium]